MEMESEVIVVAIDGSKDIVEFALEWAISNVIKPMDSLLLLALLPNLPKTRTHQFLSCLQKKRSFTRRRGSPSDHIFHVNKAVDQQDLSQRIYNHCMQMVQQLCLAHQLTKVHIEVEVLSDACIDSVATRAGELQATWVILDRWLKKDRNWGCMKHLNCNIVVIDYTIPRIIRAVNHVRRQKVCGSKDQNDLRLADMLGILLSDAPDNHSVMNQPSPGSEGTNSDTDASLFTPKTAEEQQMHVNSPSIGKYKSCIDSWLNLDSCDQKSEAYREVCPNRPYSMSRSLAKLLSFSPIEQPIESPSGSLKLKGKPHGGLTKTKSQTRKLESSKPTKTALFRLKIPTGSSILSQKLDNLNQSNHMVAQKQILSSNTSAEPLAYLSSPAINRTSNIRRAISISMKPPSSPPPLCSICKHNAPIFGKVPRRFCYKEIERATNGFSAENLLAKGGYGTVYKGVLLDGQVIAVKQKKMVSAQGASEFCSEIEVLSCAQHRNLVKLVGYCVEKEWLLVYEFACNGSLDKHLYDSDKVMNWDNRMKVAIGAARGLRYLHEDCRVGCIIHRDLRPNKILLTHDFEPLVGDFGLARRQVDGQSAKETRVIGAFGYLAPEYTETGLITEKVDVYAFGIVLLELLCGIKATDISRSTGQQFLPDMGGELVGRKKMMMMMSELRDPRLEQNYVKREAESMMHAASLCIKPRPQHRPRISKVLKILEGDVIATDMASHAHCISASAYPNQYVNEIFATYTPLPFNKH